MKEMRGERHEDEGDEGEQKEDETTFEGLFCFNLFNFQKELVTCEGRRMRA